MCISESSLSPASQIPDNNVLKKYREKIGLDKTVES